MEAGADQEKKVSQSGLEGPVFELGRPVRGASTELTGTEFMPLQRLRHGLLPVMSLWWGNCAPRLLCQHPSRSEKGPNALEEKQQGWTVWEMEKPLCWEPKTWAQGKSPHSSWALGSSSTRWWPNKEISKIPFRLRNGFKWLGSFEKWSKNSEWHVCSFHPQQSYKHHSLVAKKGLWSQSTWVLVQLLPSPPPPAATVWPIA